MDAVDAMTQIGFRPLIAAPANVLGRPLLLLHWSGATEATTLETVADARAAVVTGWTRYRVQTEEG